MWGKCGRRGGGCGVSVGGEEGGVGCVWEERRGVWGVCGRRGGGCGVSVGNFCSN